MSEPVDYRIAAGELRDFVARAFVHAGSSEEEARIVGDHLVDANLAGHDSHGVIRVAKYLDWHARGMVLANQHARVERESAANAVVDGGFGYGQVIGREAMVLGIDKAKRAGLCAIAIRNAGHLGRIGAWAEQVADAGLASVHFVNAGAPGDAPIILDISTSAIAEGKIQVAMNRGETLPPGCTIDSDGRPNQDPRTFYGPPVGALLPVGGHKGYGLSVFCEIFAGALSGGLTTNPANATANRLVNNMLSVVFDADAFCGAQAFRDEIGRMASWVRASPPIAAGSNVLLPGEIERRTRAERERDGVPLDAATRHQIAAAVRPFAFQMPRGFAA
jgi:hydroxycarboxylate dehydrogenase B